MNEVLNIEKLYSLEYYENIKNPSSPNEQVLKNINFTAASGECWSLMGGSVFEIKLLLEIMANSKAFERGRILVNGLDNTNRKRIILPDIFYIGSTNMAFGNMNVLEYLMFITSSSRRSAVLRQEYLLDFLLRVGLGYICLTPILKLTVEEKSLLLLAAAIQNPSRLIIINLPRLQYTKQEIVVLKNLGMEIRQQKKTLILSTQYNALAQAVSTHLCYIDKGSIIYSGTMAGFISKYDKVIYILSMEANPAAIYDTLKLVLPEFEYIINGDKVYIIDDKGSKNVYSKLLNALSTYGIKADSIRKNKKNIEFALQGLLETHDIQ